MRSIVLSFTCSLVCCLAVLVCRAQDALDAVAKAYQQASYENGEKFLKAGPYVRALFFNERRDEAIAVLEENIRLARKRQDGKYAAYLYGLRSLNTFILGDSAQAARYIDSASVFAARTADRKIKGYVHYCRGWLLARAGREVDAVTTFVEGLRLLENTGAHTYQRSIYSELYAIYANWRATDLQTKYAYLNLGLAVKWKEPSALFDAHMRMGHLYETLTSETGNPSFADSAVRYYRSAIALFEDNPSTMGTSPTDLAHAAINLANLHLNNADTADRRQAEKYARKAIAIADQYGHTQFKAAGYGILSALARSNHQPKNAKTYLLAALAAASQETAMNTETLPLIFRNLAELSEEQQEHTEALHYYKQYVAAAEDRFDAEKLELSARLEAQYERAKQQQALGQLRLESAQKEQQLKLMDARAAEQRQAIEVMKLNEENQRQQLAFANLQNQQKEQELAAVQREVALKSRISQTYIILFAVALFMMALLFYAYRQRSKTLTQQRHLHRLEMEQVQQQHEISNLTAMLSGQEQERSRLARDLHDGLGGLLSGTKIELSAVFSRVNDAAAREKVTRSLNQLDAAVNELRRVAHNLMPELLLKYGLTEAIREYCNRMSHGDLEVAAEIVSYTDSLDTNRQVVVYRIIQELVNNAMKHAEAKHILIQLAQADGTLYLTVEDDGKGFDVATLDGRKSAGIHNVQSRLDYLKGHLNLISEPGMGTTVEIEFPLAQPAKIIQASGS